jgi:ATP phosphoribosyltransferase regulatory subunit HisZ
MLPTASHHARIRALADLLRAHLELYGYSLIDTPIVQPADLFLTRAGDQIVDRLFTFDMRGRTYALRPEFTSSTLVEYLRQVPTGGIARWQLRGYTFEHGDGDSRDLEQFSVGAELIGLHGAAADAEIIAAGALGVAQCGVSRYRVLIGSVALLRACVQTFGLDGRAQRFLLQHIGDLVETDGHDRLMQRVRRTFLSGIEPDAARPDEDMAAINAALSELLETIQGNTALGGRRREDIARRFLEKRQRTQQSGALESAVAFLAQLAALHGTASSALGPLQALAAERGPQPAAEAAYLLRVTQLLEAQGVAGQQIVIQPALSRHWEYYSGVVFDIDDGTQRRLCGGGRYNELASLFGAPTPVPAVGLVFHAEAIQLAGSLPPATPAQPRVIGHSPDNEANAVRWAALLRAHGIACMLLPAHIAPDDAWMVQSHALFVDGVPFTEPDFIRTLLPRITT